MIETVYRVTIHYDAPWELIDRIERTVFRLKLARETAETFFGNACTSPYVTVECDTMAKATMVEGQIRRILKRYGVKEEN